jgi:hypothetical protein
MGALAIALCLFSAGALAPLAVSDIPPAYVGTTLDGGDRIKVITVNIEPLKVFKKAAYILRAHKILLAYDPDEKGRTAYGVEGIPHMVIATAPCSAQGEPIQWIADYCMLKMETDDEIAASDCIEQERKKSFPDGCASNLHFKKGMCERMIRNGTRAGTVEECMKDPTFKGRTVEAGGVGGQ